MVLFIIGDKTNFIENLYPDKDDYVMGYNININVGDLLDVLYFGFNYCNNNLLEVNCFI